MKKNIILGGVGGQGILTIAATIGTAALLEGHYLKQSEVHGMSQRGGDVQAHLRISSDPIASDLVPQGKADLVISVEPMESLRYVNMLNKKDGWLISSMNPFNNIADYPDLEEILKEIWKLPRYITIDAEKTAKEAGSIRAANIVILGAAAPFIGLKYESLEQAIRNIFGKKGEDMVNLNLKAFRLGYDYARKNQ